MVPITVVQYTQSIWPDLKYALLGNLLLFSLNVQHTEVHASGAVSL